MDWSSMRSCKNTLCLVFCYVREHGVKALPMQEASVRPLVRYILRNDKSPILLHEIPNGDLSAYVPTEKDSLMPS